MAFEAGELQHIAENAMELCAEDSRKSDEQRPATPMTEAEGDKQKAPVHPVARSRSVTRQGLTDSSLDSGFAFGHFKKPSLDFKGTKLRTQESSMKGSSKEQNSNQTLDRFPSLKDPQSLPIRGDEKISTASSLGDEKGSRNAKGERQRSASEILPQGGQTLSQEDIYSMIMFRNQQDGKSQAKQKAQLETAESELSKAKAERESLREQLEKMTAEKEAGLEQIKKYKTALSKLEDKSRQVESVGEAFAQLRSEHHSLRKTVKKLAGENKELRSLIKDSEQVIETAIASKETAMQSKVTEMEGRVQEAVAEGERSFNLAVTERQRNNELEGELRKLSNIMESLAQDSEEGKNKILEQIQCVDDQYAGIGITQDEIGENIQEIVESFKAVGQKQDKIFSDTALISAQMSSQIEDHFKRVGSALTQAEGSRKSSTADLNQKLDLVIQAIGQTAGNFISHQTWSSTVDEVRCEKVRLEDALSTRNLQLKEARDLITLLEMNQKTRAEEFSAVSQELAVLRARPTIDPGTPARLEQAEKHLRELQADLIKATKERTTFELEASSLKREVTAANQTIRDLHSQLKESEVCFDEAERAKEAMRREKESKIEEMRNHLKRAVEEEKTALNTRFATMQEASRKKAEDSKLEQKDAKTRLAQMEEQLKRETLTVKQLQSALDNEKTKFSVAVKHFQKSAREQEAKYASKAALEPARSSGPPAESPAATPSQPTTSTGNTEVLFPSPTGQPSGARKEHEERPADAGQTLQEGEVRGLGADRPETPIGGSGRRPASGAGLYSARAEGASLALKRKAPHDEAPSKTARTRRRIGKAETRGLGPVIGEASPGEGGLDQARTVAGRRKSKRQTSREKYAERFNAALEG